MKTAYRLYITLLVTVIAVSIFTGMANAAKDAAVLPKEDTEYLEGVYSATFECLKFFVNGTTGLPFDISDSWKPTSISNIGFYIAAMAVGGKTGLIEEDDAVRRIMRAFDSLEKIDKWHGFPVTWVNTSTLKRGYGESFSYADHLGNLISGMLVVQSLYPKQFRKRVDAFIKEMDFKSTYDESKGWLKGGYDLGKKDFDIKQEWGDWYYNLLAADTRHFSLLAMALKQIPDKHWDSLNRDILPWGQIDKEFKELFKDKYTYYVPGMEGGGLFMQYMPSIFLPEENTTLGESARNLAAAELEYSKKKGYYPFWGVSASESADGKEYLGWSHLKMNVVTPHASVLAIADFPKETVANLRALDEAGVRPEYKKYGKEYDFGFTDSYNIETKTASKRYLSLDQGMLFLSLANFLHENIVENSFRNTKTGKKVVKKLLKLEKKRVLKK